RSGGDAMKRHWFYILASLAGRDRHGSGIARDVLDLTDGGLRLWPATLYGSLEELRERGWIEELEGGGERPAGESERKRIYRVTGAGRRELEAEAHRLEREAAVARERLTGEAP
ncbi:MAG TPA: helix-turn-helix transcriptional regulator, partial [Longimicrobiales bacterium]|nr:helix-turn-helix transcriptional regulator [Longimicrobiales bacterium]